MKTKLSVIALLLMSAGSHAETFNFGVNAANDAKINKAKWNCKKCVSKKDVVGQAKLSAGTSISDDDQHSANALGYEDGTAGALDADVTVNYESGVRTEITTKELGSERGDAAIVVRQAGIWSLGVSYDAKYKVDSTTASSNLVAVGNRLMTKTASEVQKLELQRERLGFNAKYTGSNWSSYVNVTSEEKTGSKRSSISLGNYSAHNIIKPVDHQTQNMVAAVNMQGANWLAELGYKASWFKNDIDALYLDNSAEAAQAGSPDNTAQSLFLSGRYRFDSTSVSARLAQGTHEQDSSLVTLTGGPQGVNATNLEISTTDLNIGVVSRLSNKVILRGSLVYNDRDSESTRYEFDQITIDQVTGKIEATKAVDYTYSTFKLGGDYRVMQGHKLSAGMTYKETERSASDREETEDGELWLKYRLSALDKWDMRFKVSYSERDGSTYQVNSITSTEDNELMRKYHLADRERTQFVMDVSHTPLDYLNLDFRGYYAQDDYSASKIGLTESVDYGYDASGSLLLGKSVDVTVYGGYQWIDNDQLGSDSGGYATWAAETRDEFGFVGISSTYSGLADMGVLLSVEYNYSYSESDSLSASGNLGEYQSEGHSFEANATYAMTDDLTLGLQYQYEDYEDSDYADIAVEHAPGEGVYGLTSLGYLAQDYDAHLIMATFQYNF